MYDKLEKIEARFNYLTESLADPDVIGDNNKLRDVSKERSKLEPIIEKFYELKTIDNNLSEAQEYINSDDTEMKEMAKAEIEELTPKKQELTEELKVLMIPKDPNDDKNIYLEIRAGTGGDEAGLFANDLYKMYQKYCESQKWKFTTISYNETSPNVTKEVVIEVSGIDVYGRMKYESGVHRVQRVPATETQGRVHTSAASVAVLYQIEVEDINIDQKDLKIDTYRSQGAGGQHVNTSDSAVRITHLPTNTVVTCQDERSQLKNRASAMKILVARLQEKAESEAAATEASSRKLQVGSGDRSAKVRTYNYPQGRMTDHRIGLTLYKLDSIMNGNIGEIIDALIMEDQAEKLKGESA